MGPVGRVGLRRAEATTPRVAERVVGWAAVFVVQGEVFEERFASKAPPVVVMVMTLRAGHRGRSLECDVLAGDGLRGVGGARRGARVQSGVSMIGESAAGCRSVRKSGPVSGPTARRADHSSSASAPSTFNCTKS